jgi:peptide/nickel transport system permease protein
MLFRTWPQRIALIWLLLLLVVAAVAPVVPLAFSPSQPDLAHMAQAPSSSTGHWLGTDPQGLDVLSTLVFGARTAILLTLPAALLAAILGALAGSIAGFWGNSVCLAVPYWVLSAGAGWWALGLPQSLLVLAGALLVGCSWLGVARQRGQCVPTWRLPLGTLIMGVATTLDTIPRLVLVITLAASAGLSLLSMLMLLAITSWSHPARLVRAQMLQVRTAPFVESAWAAGLPAGRIWLRHALPHAIRPLRAAFPLSLAGLLGMESTLSFLGVGLPPDVASWGRSLATIRSEPAAWWAALPPLICLTITILSLYVLSRYQSRMA